MPMITLKKSISKSPYQSETVASKYPNTTLNGNATSSSLSGTEMYETHSTGPRESGCVCDYVNVNAVLELLIQTTF